MNLTTTTGRPHGQPKATQGSGPVRTLKHGEVGGLTEAVKAAERRLCPSLSYFRRKRS